MDAQLGQMREGRVAFVLGNGAYPEEAGPLDKPAIDAAAVSHVLERLKFSVFAYTDLDRASINERFNEFEGSLRTAEAALFYYSGHGIQVKNTNYLVPVDIDLNVEPLEDQLVSLQDLITRVSEKSETTLVFLDACRDNPIERQVNEIIERNAHAKGLPAKPIETHLGLAEFSKNTFAGETFIAFAAAPGEVAYQGNTPRSVFTEGLLSQMETADLVLNLLMVRVTRFVRQNTRNQQEPWTVSTLTDSFFFSPGTATWLLANVTGFLAFFVTIGAAIFAAKTDGAIWTVLSVLLMIATMLFLLLGIQRSNLAARGSYSGLQSDFWGSALGGYFGGVFAAPIIAGSYYLGWLWSGEQPLPFGQLITEITIAAVFAGLVLGPASYVLARRPEIVTPQRWRRWSGASLVSGTLGGIVAGLVVGPLVTWYFGSDVNRPPVSAIALIPGGLIGTCIIVFTIITYSVERLSYRSLRRNAIASVIATLCVAVAATLLMAAIYGALYRYIDSIRGMPSPHILIEAGLVVGTILGVILGSAVSLTLWLVKRSEAAESLLATPQVQPSDALAS